MAVPVENRDDVAWPDADLRQAAREPSNPLPEHPVAVPPEISINNLLVRRMHHWVVQQMLHEKRVLISG